MTAAVVDTQEANPQAADRDAFDLDVQVETEPMRVEDTACSTDDGCGTTCEISACHSQK